ncbi:uncharacterized protein LOC143810080 [Ranitomeya variabilis]|uniref:uncharacterized protein LOC143793674 n=1 Tax=Ranitomeya variabilis TaxID=490064 RepID=UPI004055E469
MDVEALYTNIQHDIGTAEAFEEFVNELNTNQCNIRLTSNYSRSSVDFLDLKITAKDNRINTTLFRKKTATNSVLHYSSFHPNHLRNSIPKGQFLRVRRNCSTTTDFQNESRQLTNRFLERGYPRRAISRAFENARQKPREEVLKVQPRANKDQLSLVTRYNNQWDDVRRLMNDNWGILLSDSRLRTLVPNGPKMVARRARNLKDHLSRSHFRRCTSRTHSGLTGGNY